MIQSKNALSVHLAGRFQNHTTMNFAKWTDEAFRKIRLLPDTELRTLATGKDADAKRMADAVLLDRINKSRAAKHGLDDEAQ